MPFRRKLSLWQSTRPREPPLSYLSPTERHLGRREWRIPAAPTTHVDRLADTRFRTVNLVLFRAARGGVRVRGDAVGTNQRCGRRPSLPEDASASLYTEDIGRHGARDVSAKRRRARR